VPPVILHIIGRANYRVGEPVTAASLAATRWSKIDSRANVKLQREWESLAERAQEALPEGTFTMPDFGSDLRPAVTKVRSSPSLSAGLDVTR
jgi:hypothetical protein